MESPRLGDSPDGATSEETAADSDVPEIELIIKVIFANDLTETQFFLVFILHICVLNNVVIFNPISRHQRLMAGEKEPAYFVTSTLWTYTCWQSLKRSP